MTSTSTKTLLSCGVAAVALLVASPAFADDIAAQIQLMRQQIQKQAQEIKQQQDQIQQQQDELQTLAAGVDQSKAQATQA
jgi:septal ring factor EnvC (AmiA/AmiB activator)